MQRLITYKKIVNLFLGKNILLFLFLSLSFLSFSQFIETASVERVKVKWVAEFPPKKESSNKPKVLMKIGEFLFGKKVATVVKPMAIIAENPNNFWIIDQGSRTLIKVNDYNGFKPRIFQKTSFNFSSLVGFCLLPNGSLLFSDSSTGNVYILNENEKSIEVFNKGIELKQPTGIAFNTVTKQIWVLETAAHKITILNEKGSVIREIGKRGNAFGEFNYPTHIWVDKSGDVYVVDSMNFRVQIFDKDGNFNSQFGEIGDSSGYFARPKGVATDSYNNIYVVDALFNTVQIFDKSGNFLYNFGNKGKENGEFWMPTGIYIDKENYIYVADAYNSRVQVFQLINGE